MIAFPADSANLSDIDVEFSLTDEIPAESFEAEYARINRSIPHHCFLSQPTLRPVH